MKYLRLKKQADFQRLFQKGMRAFSPSLTMLYRPSDKMRMGISIGKKHGKSVRRNRIKRLLREAFRSAQGNMQRTYSVVLVPKVRDEYSFQTFERHLKCMIEKENL
ncbi:MAG: ribonuclease P protein component [Clostridia bacterium]|nr:ribonuclease P protein component [Clostridia bacterium]